MIPTAFDYYTADTVEQAIRLLKEHSDAKVLAGGHSLIPMMKLRLATPEALVDIGKIKDLAYIRESGGDVLVGALTTHTMVEQSQLIAEKLPAMSDAAKLIADVQVRNWGTVGGSAVHADPASDLPAVLLALNARFRIQGAQQREVFADDFFVDLMTTAVQDGEILTEIVTPSEWGRVSAYAKLPNPASHFAVVGVAAALKLGADRTVQDARVAITGAVAKPTRAAGTEEALKGKRLDADTIAAAASRAGEGIDALSDIHGSAEYRTAMCAVFARRALTAAMGRA